jgi:Golgi nucleoside diphosphatase
VKKLKGKPPLVFYMTNMQAVAKTVIALSSVFLGGYLLLSWGSLLSSSGNAHIKVIPHNLNDAALDQLSRDRFSYAIVVDAGSSGSRAHVYRYGKLDSSTGNLYVLPKHSSYKVKPGLSSFASSPNSAGPALEPLIDFLKKEVPEDSWSTTPIWLKATAGLRMLDSSQSAQILVSVRQFLSDKSKSPFKFQIAWAKIISGNEEGAYGWIAFNYLKKIIGPKRPAVSNEEPYAVIEMGGASSQVNL